MTLTDRDAAIYAQVAHKSAVEAGDDVLTEPGAAAYEQRFSYYTESLLAGINALQAQHATTVPTQKGYDPEAAIRSELGGTDQVVEIVQTKDGGQKGPLPAWFIKAAAEAGVTRAYDNRGGENPKSPWFKCADTKKPFWPPK